VALKDHVAPGKADRLARSYIGRLALQRMMAENGIAAFVHPENTVPTPKIQGPNVGNISLEGITPFLQIPRVVVPGGMNDVVVEPQYARNAAKTDYIATIAPNTPKTTLPHPIPIAITFFAGQVRSRRSSRSPRPMSPQRTTGHHRQPLVPLRRNLAEPRRHNEAAVTEPGFLTGNAAVTSDRDAVESKNTWRLLVSESSDS
jgi:hypothetical protein